MKIKKIIMETDEGRFEYIDKAVPCTGCEACAFKNELCYGKVPCCAADSGYWVKTENKPVTNGDRYKEDE